MRVDEPVETILWSVALPGFGQILNGKYLKGLLFIGLEFWINLNSRLNGVIIASFHGDVWTAVQQTNFQWLMFYPCLYMFAMWDAYRDAGGGTSRFAYLPFVMGAYFGTVGVAYSATLQILGGLWGPVWLPILFLLLGVAIGLLLKQWFTKISQK
ncbi:hypothetical protein [Effusibacillus pohliae]|uniref:hypothetical protein n=1 Tax=Effusibacillus pohliae TaxID=232270 RepID=UPI00037DF83A|nr:hypothetical protein [Effusibacillus pohliae]